MGKVVEKDKNGSRSLPLTSRVEISHCAGCGMTTESAAEYHPILACYGFKVMLNSESVRANLQAVVEYGMDAQRYGISIEDAMSNISSVIDPKFQGA